MLSSMPPLTPDEGPSAEDVRAAIETGAKAICQCLLGFSATRVEAWERTDFSERSDYLRAAEACLTQAVPVLFRKDPSKAPRIPT